MAAVESAPVREASFQLKEIVQETPEESSSAACDNISKIRSLLQDSTITDLPERYVWKQATSKQNLSNCQDEPALTLPVVDLGGLRSDDPEKRARVVKEIGVACEEWGFVQIINHGLSEELAQEVDTQARKFFNLPVETKEKAKYKQKSRTFAGYDGRMSARQSAVPWNEYLSDKGMWVEPLTKMIWPEGNPAFSKPLEEYWTKVEKLAIEIVEILAQHLGLESTIFSQYFKGEKAYDENLEDTCIRSTWRLNYYPPCPRPDLTFGLGPHSDPNLLTVLKQDTVGGLQVRKNSKWVDVNPVPDALIVNIGDTFEAWSNARYPSVEHRVKANETQDRLSCVYFLANAKSQLVKAPPQLIDEEHPARYQSFTYGDHLANILKLGFDGKRGLALWENPIPSDGL